MTHAFFKALLFLGAGSVIHAMHHEQDIRFMGGLKKHLPITHVTFLLGCIAIAGIPPFSGFFSKDEILAAAFSKNIVYWIVGVLTAGMTAFYMFRLYASTFLGEFRGNEDQRHHLHESPAAMTIPLVVLAILAVVGGLVGIPAVFAEDAHALEHYLSPVFAESTKLRESHHLDHSTEYLLMGVSVAIALVAIFIAVNRFRKKPELQEPSGFGKVLANKWYVDEIYQGAIIRPINYFSKFLNRGVERNFIDWIVNGVGRLLQYGSRQIRWIQSGQVGSYVLLMVVSMLVFFVIQFFL